VLNPATVPLGIRADEEASLGQDAVGLCGRHRRATGISTLRRLREWCACEAWRDAGA
jgi:hypothetical protein